MSLRDKIRTRARLIRLRMRADRHYRLYLRAIDEKKYFHLAKYQELMLAYNALTNQGKNGASQTEYHHLD